MKTIVRIFILGLLASACNRKEMMQPASKTPAADSAFAKQMRQKDSSILAYVRTINTIQESVDTLMRQAKMIKMKNESASTVSTNVVDVLRAINMQMVRNRRALFDVEMKLKKSNQANNDLADLGENLSKELNQRDSEISEMQKELFRTKTSLNNLTKQFNDSITVINQERAQIGLMTTQGNTVYFIVGTLKELRAKGVITDEGGVVGLGRVPVLSQEMNSSGFNSADLTTLHELQLGGFFLRMVTVHPPQSYKIIHSSTDELLITDPSDFWSKSKYMVAVITR